MLDRYIFGEVTRVSPEAPVPVCEAGRETAVLGGAANVCRNLNDFGCDVDLVGVIGHDADGQEMRSLCEQMGIHCGLLVEDSKRPTTVKTRILGNGQQILRLDREKASKVTGSTQQAILKACESLVQRVDAIIVSDYAKGVMTEAVAGFLGEAAQSGKIVAVDPHPLNRVEWSGYTILKPNLGELQKISGQFFSKPIEGPPMEYVEFRTAIDEVRRRWMPKHFLVTMSANGMFYTDFAGEQAWVKTRAAEVFDVSGAGDTSMSYFVLAIAAGWSGAQATELAIHVSGKVVRKIGTASLSFEEVLENLPDK